MKRPLYALDRRFVTTLDLREAPEAIIWDLRLFLLQTDNAYVEVRELPAGVQAIPVCPAKAPAGELGLGVSVPAQGLPTPKVKHCHPPDKPSPPPPFVQLRAPPAPVGDHECPRCGKRVRDDCTFLHSLEKCRRVVKVKPLNIPTHRLPFTLLPTGKWNIHDVIKHYRNASHNLPTGLQGHTIDESRLIKIWTLNPLQCYIGNKTWRGYIVFEFKDSTSVVLGCPFEGNAAYILPADWKAMAGHTKRELSRLFENRYTKVVHKNDWLSRICEARGSF